MSVLKDYLYFLNVSINIIANNIINNLIVNKYSTLIFIILVESLFLLFNDLLFTAFNLLEATLSWGVKSPWKGRVQIREINNNILFFQNCGARV